MPARQSLSHLLDATFQVMGSTWKTALVTGGLLFVPASWLIGEASGRMFGSLAQMVSLAAHGQGPAAGPLMRALVLVHAWSFAAAGALGLATLFVRACVTSHTAAVVSGRQTSLSAIVRKLTGKPLLRLVGQRLLLTAINTVVLAAAMVPAIFVIAAAAAADAPVVAVVSVLVLMMTGLAIMSWLSVRFGVALEALVIDDLAVDASLTESTRVVRGRWWRVLGRMLAITSVASLGSFLISAPVVAFRILRAYVDFFGALIRGMEDAGEQTVNFLEALAGLSGRMAVSTYLASLLTAFVVPGFMTLLFLDLRALHEREAAPDAAPATAPRRDEPPAGQEGPPPA